MRFSADAHQILHLLTTTSLLIVVPPRLFAPSRYSAAVLILVIASSLHSSTAPIQYAAVCIYPTAVHILKFTTSAHQVFSRSANATPVTNPNSESELRLIVTRSNIANKHHNTVDDLEQITWTVGQAFGRSKFLWN
ncbi:hypothetical protein OROGR_009353 [Orobanche gracilis]